jgi:hypothetical protein
MVLLRAKRDEPSPRDIPRRSIEVDVNDKMAESPLP